MQKKLEKTDLLENMKLLSYYSNTYILKLIIYYKKHISKYELETIFIQKFWFLNKKMYK